MTLPIETLHAIEAIRRTIAQYAQLIDDLRFDEWQELFTADAEFWSIPGHHLPGGHEIAKIVGRDAIVAAIAPTERAMAQAGGILHFNAPQIVDVSGDTAKAWWDFLVLHVLPDGIATKFAGRYYADFVLQDGRWRFLRRISVRPGYPLPEGIMPTPSTQF